ncbi:hypothetical protein Tco_1305269 [Tanacetum coccineum]
MEDGGEIVSARVVSRVVLGLVPEPIHTTLPNDDYVPHDTKSIMDELLEEFRDEILNVTMVDDEADFNPTKDLEELEKLLAKEPQSKFYGNTDRDIISLGWALQRGDKFQGHHDSFLMGHLARNYVVLLHSIASNTA